MSINELDFGKLSISHDEPTDNDHWTSLLKEKNDPGFDFDVSKVLVFKPKTPKSQTPIPIVVVALASTQTPSGIIAKAAGAKDPRMASADLISEFFGGISPKDVGALAVTESNATKIKIIVDKKLADSSKKVAAHTNKSSVTVFIEGSELIKYYESLGAGVEVVDFSAAPAASSGKPAAAAATKEVSAGAKDAAADASTGNLLIGITVDKELDFPGWYQQIVTKSEMLEYYDVSGCYIMRPNSYNVWETVQKFFDDKIKSIGVQNAYFPLFVSRRVLEKEKDHIEGFAPEVAWVTKAGSSDLEEPVAIRPTSETVMYPYYAKWIRSHRDLPLRLNQWNSVVRWEFKHPQPFLRTREFLWQEGHTAHLTYESANEEVLLILEWYKQVYNDLLAVPVVPGRKTEKEKFAGALFTTTVEGYIPTTGRGIQGGTSHCLGQNFSKMFSITVENPEGPSKPKIHVWQNSWGLSTRVIGVMVMVHSDNKGLVLPPRVASTQAMVIPCGITAQTSEADRQAIQKGAEEVESILKKAGVRASGDYRDNYRVGWKFADSELKGIPLRLEVGPADLKKEQAVAVRRDTGEKIFIPLKDLATTVPKLLDTIHNDMYAKAKKSYDDHRITVHSIEEMITAINKKCVCLAPFCGGEDCEDDIKERTARRDDDEEVDDRAPSMGAKSLCIPFERPELKEGTKCVGCGKKAEFYTMFGRSY